MVLLIIKLKYYLRVDIFILNSYLGGKIIMKKRLRVIIPTIVVIFILMSFVTLGQEVQLGIKQTLDVWVGSNKINYNNNDVTNQLNTVVINGTTYIPLRNAGELFGKNIQWNDALKTVYITDTGEDNDLKTQLAIKNAEIEQLKKLLEGGDLDDIEDKLNDDYGTYRKVDFSIKLTKKNDEITVKISADEDDWDDLSSSRQESFLQGICDDIFDEFRNVDITGYIKDGSNKFVEFECEYREDVEIEGSSGDIGDLEDDINDALYDKDFGKLYRIDLDDLSIDLVGDEDKITFYIDIDLDDYDDEWDDLDEDEIEDFMEEVYDFIKDDKVFGDADIEGYFYDTDGKKKLVKLYESGSRVKFTFY